MSSTEYRDTPDDPAAAEQAARDWAEYQRLMRNLHNDARERVLAAVTARLIGADSTAADDAMHEHFEFLDADVARELYKRVLWYGETPAVMDAKARLELLRDAYDVAPVARLINGGMW